MVCPGLLYALAQLSRWCSSAAFHVCRVVVLLGEFRLSGFECVASWGHGCLRTVLLADLGALMRVAQPLNVAFLGT